MTLDDLFSRMRDHLSVSRAFGTAYEKDGAMIVPVALVAGGGGGGQGTSSPGDGAPPDGDKAAREESSGSGGGFGGVVVPVGVYEMRDGKVRWIPAINANLVFVVAIVGLRLAARAVRRRAR
jgi:uncharacterized spore protein YtfJ